MPVKVYLVKSTSIPSRAWDPEGHEMASVICFAQFPPSFPLSKIFSL